MGRCSECNCPCFVWNPMAAARGEGLRICMCGHHFNYHGNFRKEEVKKESTIETKNL